MANIVVLVGSPRKNGNTEKLADAFIKGARAAGHEVTKFSVASTRVNGCLGCNHCLKNDGHCLQKDGMQEIYPALYKADTVVFATPVYYYGMAAQMKAIIDRFYAALEMPYPVTSAALLVALGGDAQQDAAATVASYHTIIDYLQWEDKGVVVAGGVVEKGDVDGKPVLLEAEELGKSI